MYLAIDIGGTKTLIALFSARGRVVRRVKFKTAHSSRQFITDLTRALAGFSRRKVSMVTVAIPGTVQKNYSVSFGNRNWPNLDLITPIKNLFSCPIYFENDANLAALYEGSFYRGKVVFLTFSTGIGGGVVENGRILPESSSFEPGHKIYTYKGRAAEWEDLASSHAIEGVYHVDMATSLRKKAEMQDVAARVALGLRQVVNDYSPSAIVIGGPLGKIFKRFSKYLPSLGVKLVRPRRPLESVIYGCYIFGKNQK